MNILGKAELRMKLIFLLGSTNDDQIAALEAESKKHADLLVVCLEPLWQI